LSDSPPLRRNQRKQRPDPNEDKKNYFVSASGLTVVTRDYSVYENPVSPEFLQQGGN